MTTALVKATQRELASLAHAGVQREMTAYFKGAVAFLGVKMPDVRATASALMPSLKARSIDDVAREAFAFLRSPFMEMKAIGCAILARQRRRLPDDFLDVLAPIFDDGHVADWATCDDLAGHVLREMVARGPATRTRVIAWSRANNDWRKRAAAVAFANECRKVCHGDDILDVCAHVVASQNRFAQLGCGWALREMSLHEEERVVAFVLDNARLLTREGLRYATDKMPPHVRDDVRARHAAASGRGRRAASVSLAEA